MLTIRPTQFLDAGLIAKLNLFPEILDKHLLPALDRLEIEAVALAQRNAAKSDFTGNNRMAIHGETLSKYVRAVAPGSDHAVYVEGGVKPNQPRMPNVSGLYPWVAANLPGVDPRVVSRKTYAIARGIQKKGIRAQPFMGPTREAMVPRAEQLLFAAADDAVIEIIGGA